MAGGLRDEIDLDVTGALAQVGRIEAALDATAKSFRVELANALDVLRVADTHVDVTADARQVTGAITGAVDAADTGVVVTGEAREVTGAITGAVDAADTTVDVDVDPKAFRQLKADIDKVNAELNDTRAQLNKVEGELDQVRRKGGDVEKSFGGIRAAAAGALAALGTRFVIDQVQEMIGAASDLAESQSKVDVVFGASQSVIDEWASSSATAVGLAKQQALEAAGTFGNLFTALGLTQNAAAKLAPDVVQLGADLASFNNLGVPETLEKLRSGLVGEIEPLRSLGISFGALDVERKAMELGLESANGTITEGAKVQARWALITEQSRAAAGDFARTSDGLANQQRILSAEFGNLQAEIGARLLPTFLKGVKGIRELIGMFEQLPEPVQDVILVAGALTAVLAPLALGGGAVVSSFGNIAKAAKSMATTLGVSTTAFGAVAVGATALVGVYLAYRQVQQAIEDGERELNNSSANLINTRAAYMAQGIDLAAVNFLEAEALAAGTLSLDKFLAGYEHAGDVTAREQAQINKGADALRAISEASDVAIPRLADLATEMGINLGTATREETEALSKAADELNAAISPTARLEAQTSTLTDEFATAKEAIDAFSEALDAALGVFLTSEEATIRVRTGITDLAKELAAGREEGESYQAFQDRLTLSSIDLTRKIEDEVEALTRDGTITADAASQKEALISRLLAVADTIGGPVADELRKHAYRVATIPDAAETKVTADTTQAVEALEGVPPLAELLGEDTGQKFTQGVAKGISARGEVERARNAAEAMARSVSDAAKGPGGFDEGSPSKVGVQIGSFFVEGIALGVEQTGDLAEQAAQAVALGVAEQVHEVAQLTVAEQLAILDAVDAMGRAEETLAEVRADGTSSALDRQRAELEVAEAQERVNEALFAGSDASAKLAEVGEFLTAVHEAEAQALRDLNDQLDRQVGAIDAVSGVRGAQRALDDAEAERAAALSRARKLPGEVADAEDALSAARRRAAATTDEEALAIIRARQGVTRAEEALAAAQADATSTTDELRAASLELDIAEQKLKDTKEAATAPTREVIEAERALEELRKEESESARRVQEANDAVTDAQLRLVQSQRDLIESGAELVGTGPEVEDYFRTIAEQAGLTRRQIDNLIDSMREAGQLGQNANRSSGGSGGRLINTVTGRPAFTGPNGEGGSGGPRGVAGETSWTMPDGTRVWYVPRQNIDRGNLGALGRVPVTANLPTTKPAPVGSKKSATSTTQNITINPKKAVYDPKATVATLRTLELLR